MLFTLESDSWVISRRHKLSFHVQEGDHSIEVKILRWSGTFKKTYTLVVKDAMATPLGPADISTASGEQVLRKNLNSSNNC